MEYNIELLGIIVGSIATILGGVWFKNRLRCREFSSYGFCEFLQ